jgi:hypothetical protein
MFQNISEILKSFSGKQRFAVLALLLLTILCSIFIKSYFSTTDLAPMQKQLNECVAAQGNLVTQNATLVSKTKDLTDGYLKIDSMLTHIKPDTVYIVKTEKIIETQPIALAKNNPKGGSDVSNDGGIMMAAVPEPEAKKESKKDTSITKTVKKGNMKEIYSDLHEIVEKAKK